MRAPPQAEPASVAPPHQLPPRGASQLLLLGGCGVASLAIYLLAFTLPYSLDRGLASPLATFSRLSGLSISASVAYGGSIAALFAIYLLALRLCAGLEQSRAAAAIVVVVGFACALVLLPMYPIFSLDIFYYMAADRIWSVYRENPFVVPPLQAAHDPFFPYTTWGHYPLPYGPLWPWITEITSKLPAGDLAATLLSFKALAVLGYLLCLPAVAWLARTLSPTRWLTGLCIFAWSPLVLIELAGNGHNDAIALVPATLAFALSARGSSAGAAASLTVSFLVKATAIVTLPALLWASFDRARRSGRLPRWAVSHLLPSLALVILAWLPFWRWGQSASFLREADQHFHSLTALLVAFVPTEWKPEALRLVQIALVAGFALYYWSRRAQLALEGRTALRTLWWVTVCYFAVVQPFYMGWYIIWPTVMAAGLVEGRITVLTTLLAVGGFLIYVVQFVVAPLAGPSFGWAERNLLALLVGFGPFLVGWAASASRFQARRQSGPA